MVDILHIFIKHSICTEIGQPSSRPRKTALGTMIRKKKRKFLKPSQQKLRRSQRRLRSASHKRIVAGIPKSK